ncbi:hypothetical protein E2C01_019229 [Portunus trituberculatus]|uniref:Uncharacterized protein n=1 Tax=Portunus trituberculatus TaxID=210409 RepID=A0A5B7DYA9_PORTR|nr:hypothetical protein [Portunus trituberculatus]
MSQGSGSLCGRQGTTTLEFKSPSVHSVVRYHPTAKRMFPPFSFKLCDVVLPKVSSSTLKSLEYGIALPAMAGFSNRGSSQVVVRFSKYIIICY